MQEWCKSSGGEKWMSSWPFFFFGEKAYGRFVYAQSCGDERLQFIHIVLCEGEQMIETWVDRAIALQRRSPYPCVIRWKVYNFLLSLCSLSSKTNLLVASRVAFLFSPWRPVWQLSRRGATSNSFAWCGGRIIVGCTAVSSHLLTVKERASNDEFYVFFFRLMFGYEGMQ